MAAPKRQNIKDLPQWAQDKIQALEAEASEWKTALDKYLDDTTPTRVAVVDHVRSADGATHEVRHWVSGSRVEVYGAGVSITILPTTTDAK